MFGEALDTPWAMTLRLNLVPVEFGCLPGPKYNPEANQQTWRPDLGFEDVLKRIEQLGICSLGSKAFRGDSDSYLSGTTGTRLGIYVGSQVRNKQDDTSPRSTNISLGLHESQHQRPNQT